MLPFKGRRLAWAEDWAEDDCSTKHKGLRGYIGVWDWMPARQVFSGGLQQTALSVGTQTHLEPPIAGTTTSIISIVTTHLQPPILELYTTATSISIIAIVTGIIKSHRHDHRHHHVAENRCITHSGTVAESRYLDPPEPTFFSGPYINYIYILGFIIRTDKKVGFGSFR